jgi:ABC-type branched-subunit amino acid transport system permease subunit
MQAVLGSITAWLLYRLVWSRFGRIVVAPKNDGSLDKRIQARG